MCCEKAKKCQKPENLKDAPEKCSPEQIRECHGSDQAHPCTDENKNSDAD